MKIIKILPVLLCVLTSACSKENTTDHQGSAVHTKYGKLIFASDVLRHGARTSTKYNLNIKYPSSWSSKNISPGQLTQNGFWMEVQNGRYFGKIYSGFLPSNATKVCVVSDGSNRDIMSAEGVISGLYPNLQERLNIRVITHDEDILLVSKKDSSLVINAPGWDAEWKKYGYLSGVLLKHKLIKQREYCDKSLTGVKSSYDCILPLQRVGSQITTLRSFCSVSKACDVSKIIGLPNNQLNSLVKVFNFQRLHKAVPTNDVGFIGYVEDYRKDSISSGGAVLVSQVIHNMSDIINKNSKTQYPKFIVYAGHDDSIMYNIGYLTSVKFSGKTILKGNAGYGADLSFRLYKLGDKYNVVVSYRNSYYDKKEVEIYAGSFNKFKKNYFIKNQLDRQKHKNIIICQIK